VIRKFSLGVLLLLWVPILVSAGSVTEFTFTDLNGTTYTSAGLKGTPLVVNIGSHG
jgi:hypothetical protein